MLFLMYLNHMFASVRHDTQIVFTEDTSMLNKLGYSYLKILIRIIEFIVYSLSQWLSFPWMQFSATKGTSVLLRTFSPPATCKLDNILFLDSTNPSLLILPKGFIIKVQ